LFAAVLAQGLVEMKEFEMARTRIMMGAERKIHGHVPTKEKLNTSLPRVLGHVSSAAGGLSTDPDL